MEAPPGVLTPPRAPSPCAPASGACGVGRRRGRLGPGTPGTLAEYVSAAMTSTRRAPRRSSCRGFSAPPRAVLRLTEGIAGPGALGKPRVRGRLSACTPARRVYAQFDHYARYWPGPPGFPRPKDPGRMRFGFTHNATGTAIACGLTQSHQQETASDGTRATLPPAGLPTRDRRLLQRSG